MKASRETVAAVVAAAVLLGGGGAAAAGIVNDMAVPDSAVALHPAAAVHQVPPAGGLVLGIFIRVGGPLGPGGKQPPEVRLSGTMRFTRGGHAAITVRVGKAGTFAARLAPGRYRVSGTTPEIRGEPGNIEATCSLPGTVTVSAGLTRHVTVVCAVP
jgi:hypothetical protein